MDKALVERVDLLCLDAGNTIVFLDHPRIARFLAAHGVSSSEDALVRAEGVAKRELASRGEPLRWKYADEPGAGEWGRVIGTTIGLGGTPRERVPELLAALWEDHGRHNLYSRVPEGLPDAVGRLRARGVKVVVVSNSEGKLVGLLETLGILGIFDRVLDSSVVGVAKPDPRIFGFALDTFGISKERALHLGDTFATDIAGARAAGIRTALIDPFGHYTGLHADVPRVESVEQVADAILATRLD